MTSVNCANGNRTLRAEAPIRFWAAEGTTSVVNCKADATAQRRIGLS